MSAEITRRLLSWQGKQRALSGEAMDAALKLSGLRPGIAEWREFAVRAMKSAGVLSLAAGMVFLVAFNWQALGVLGRFAIVQLTLLLAVAAAWIQGTERLVGKLALILAVLLTGTLLALFGQTYQTGADLYELFLTWALLTVPWVVACSFEPCWALWLLVLNTAATLYAAGAKRAFFGLLDAQWGLTPWLLPFLLNIAAYVVVEALSRRSTWGFASAWLGRGLVAIAASFGTLIAIRRILLMFGSEPASSTAAGVFEVLLFIAVSAGFLVYASRRKDLFPFAVLAFAWVVVTTSFIGRLMAESHAGLGALFLVALYVIGSSGAAVKAISVINRRWNQREATE